MSIAIKINLIQRFFCSDKRMKFNSWSIIAVYGQDVLKRLTSTFHSSSKLQVKQLQAKNCLTCSQKRYFYFVPWCWNIRTQKYDWGRGRIESYQGAPYLHHRSKQNSSLNDEQRPPLARRYSLAYQFAYPFIIDIAW